jgi:hypothetical protein
VFAALRVALDTSLPTRCGRAGPALIPLRYRGSTSIAVTASSAS